MLSGGTLKIYGESLCRDVPYKTLLLSIRDCAQAVVREMLAKYGLDKTDPLHYCLVQVSLSANLHVYRSALNINFEFYGSIIITFRFFVYLQIF